MKVKVNVDEIGVDISSLIKIKLKVRGIPECLGDMSPPIITNVVEMDTSLFPNKSITPPESIVLDNILPLLVDSYMSKSDLVRNCVLDTNGEIEISKYKEQLSDYYVERVSKCIDCRFTSLCNQLTTHYLKTIQLREKI